MAGCLSGCPSFRTDSVQSAWEDIRDFFGPRTSVGSSRYIEDLSYWNIYAAEKSLDPVTDVSTFGKWLIWKCKYGSNNYGNLPTRVRDHEGVSCVPCPYSTDSSDVRSLLWLGSEPTLKNDHGSYYMKVSQRGSVWGWECTNPNCQYKLDTGNIYFHN